MYKTELALETLENEKNSKELLPIAIKDERNLLSFPEEISKEYAAIRAKKILEQFPKGAEIEVFDLGRSKKAFLLPIEEQSERWLKVDYLCYSVENSDKHGCCPASKINVVKGKD